jgi:DNA-binding transcriptional ArsR family regulator
MKPVYARWEWLEALELSRKGNFSDREIGDMIRKKYGLEKGFDRETVSRNVRRDLPRVVAEMQKYLAKHRSLSYQQLSLTAKLAQWEALLDGYWKFAERSLAPDYQLGRNDQILKNEIGSSALLQALEEVSLGVSWSAAAEPYGFSPGFLRSVRDEPYFHYGLVQVPVQVLDELERNGRNCGRRIRSVDPEFAWVHGKHPASLSEDLVKRLPKTRAWNLQVLTGKIALIFSLRAYSELTFQEIGEKLQIPWQTVGDLIRNPKCIKVVGEDLWGLARQVKAWRMIRVGKENRRRILEAVSQGIDTTEAIAKAKEMDRSTVTHTLRDLKTTGDITRERGPDRFFRYKISDKGKNHPTSSASQADPILA